MKPCLLVMIGASGSGKSTYAESLGLPIVSTDAIRAELYSDETVQDNPKHVFAIAFQRVREHLMRGESCVFDATNTTVRARKAVLDAVSEVECQRIGLLVYRPLAVCLRQNRMRARRVPNSVIIRQCQQLDAGIATVQDEFDVVIVV